MIAQDGKDDQPSREISKAETWGYITALLVILVDNLGYQFTSPEIVTYSEWMGASVDTVADFFMARAIANMVSLLWMPVLSDRCGCRKWVAFTSTVGVTIGYTFQACAYLFRDPDLEEQPDWSTACYVLLTGRIIVGFFSGMQPVLQAYITELSAPDSALITQRLVVVQVMANAMGVLVSPISGVLALGGLQIPFFAVAGCGLFSIVIVPVFFREVKYIRTDLAVAEDPTVDPSGISMQAAEGLEKSDADAAEPLMVLAAPPSNGNPALDLVVFFLFLSYMFLMFVISGVSIFLPPLLFHLECYGIKGGPTGFKGDPDYDPGDPDEFKQNISFMMSMVNIPFGLLQVMVAILLFVPVTKKFGEVPVVLGAGLLSSSVFPMIGFTQHMWQIFVIWSIGGACFGFISPAIGPVAARYGLVMYPKQVALVQGIPIMGMMFSNVFSQKILAAIVGEDLENDVVLRANIKNAFYAVAGSNMLYVILFSVAARLAQTRITAASTRINAASTGAPAVDPTAEILSRSTSESLVAAPLAVPALQRALSKDRPRPQIGNRVLSFQ